MSRAKQKRMWTSVIQKRLHSRLKIRKNRAISIFSSKAKMNIIFGKKNYDMENFFSKNVDFSLRVCARWKVPAKRFKICHILYIRRPKVAFFVFHFVLLYILPNECPGLCRHVTIRKTEKAFLSFPIYKI